MAGIEAIVTFKGFDDITRLLRETLPVATQQSVLVGAWKKAARPLVKKTRALYRGLGGSGSLAIATKAFRWKAARAGRGSIAVVHVGPVRGDRQALAAYFAHYASGGRVASGRFVSGLRHAHLVEWGATRKQQGVMPAFRVLERAWSATRAEVIAEFQRILAADVEKAIAKARR